MLKLHPLLAQFRPNEMPPPPGPPTGLFGLSLAEVMLVVGIISGLAVILFFWAYWTRRDPRRGADAGERVLYSSDARKEGKVKVRRRRSRHPNNLPRNPTLAEAGGLPPVRDEPAEPAC